MTVVIVIVIAAVVCVVAAVVVAAVVLAVVAGWQLPHHMCPHSSRLGCIERLVGQLPLWGHV